MVTETEIQQLRSRVNGLEDRLKILYRHLHIEYADPGSDPIMSPKIEEALRSGNKIEAIKIYRELTAVGLAEAKAAIDRAGGSSTIPGFVPCQGFINSILFLRNTDTTSASFYTPIEDTVQATPPSL